MTGTTEPVVAGIDGSWPSRGALRWAIREAGMRRRPLRIVYVYRGSDREQAAWARSVVCDAVVEARRLAPGLPIEGAVLAGPPVARLRAESRNAALLVVASRGRGGFPELRLGSVADQLTRYAYSPVMVVHNAQRWVNLGTSLTSARPVVVGIANSPGSDLAVGFAFEEAQGRGVAVLAVRGWPPPPDADALVGVRSGTFAAPTHDHGRAVASRDRVPAVAAGGEPSAAQRRLIAAALSGWQAKFPFVPVRQRVVPQEPVIALLASAREADLVVVGSRGSGGFPGQLLGSVSEQVLQYVPCAVVVVPGQAPGCTTG